MKIEYSIREVTRYVLTEYHESEDNDPVGCIGSKVICEFDHRPYAEDMCNRLNQSQLDEAYPYKQVILGRAT